MVAGFLVGLQGSTHEAYRIVLRSWLAWCSVNGIDALHARSMHVEAFTSRRGRNGKPTLRSKRNAISIIDLFYRYLVAEGFTDRNPAVNVRRPRIVYHSQGSFLNREQASAFLREAHASDSLTDALCTLLLLTGCRISEALGLKIEDCHLDDDVPWVLFHRKFDWMQRVAIPKQVVDALRRHIGRRKHGRVFKAKRGGRMYGENCAGLISSVALNVGVPDITPHSLRRSFCTLSRDAGIPDKDIMAAGGWKTPQMLEYYDMSARSMSGIVGNGLQEFLAEE